MTTAACAHCGQSFTTRDKRQRFCSRACVWASARATLAGAQAEGADPTHGGTAAEARRASLARRRAAGELIGRAAAKAKREGTYDKPDTPPPALPASEWGAAWRETGEARETQAARALGRDRRERGKTLVLAGHGAGLRVERGALVVTDGHTHSTHTPARHVLHRAVHGVGRIVCVAPSGSLSFDAMQWCREQGITLILLDWNGELLATMTPESPGHAADVTLRRRQYEAALTGCDVEVARWVIQQKLEGQLDTLRRVPTLPRAAVGCAGLATALLHITAPHTSGLTSIIGVRTFEGRAAALYFDAWTGYPLKWRKADRRYVPPHWHEIRTRHSPLSDNARRAIDPTNAILNYAYGVLEGQCRRALTAAGFDVACGFLHADKQYRDSLVYDLMELYRPAVDALVLNLLARTTFTYGDCTPTSDGQCNLHPQLARAVVAACRLPDTRIAEGGARLRLCLNAVMDHCPRPPDEPAVPVGVTVPAVPAVPAEGTGGAW